MYISIHIFVGRKPTDSRTEDGGEIQLLDNENPGNTMREGQDLFYYSFKKLGRKLNKDMKQKT